MKPKIAFFSPLNTVQSGISDYSEELLPVLAKGVNIDLFVDGYRPQNKEIQEKFSVFQAKDYLKNGPYDINLYHMGNSPAHAYIYDAQSKNPGVVVLHD